MKNDEVSPLNPSLWRTCRALANVNRLTLMRELMTNGPRTVSELAATLHWSASKACQYLRMLNARGLLSAVRNGRYVTYKPEANPKIEYANLLVHAIENAFVQHRRDIPYVFKHLTAFTHERRIRIMKVLVQTPLTGPELAAATSISLAALHRHLTKLQKRKYVEFDRELGKYRSLPVREEFPETLLQLVVDTQ